MIFLDANIFLRYLIEPKTPNDQVWNRAATGLIRAVARGDEQATTTEAVLTEITYVLNSKRQYNVSPAEIAATLEVILRLQNLHLPRGAKQRYLRALDLWRDRPALGFVDALTAVTVQHSDMLLATFDAHFDDVPGIQRWQRPDE